MSVPVNTDCLLCYLERNIALAKTLGTEEQAMAFARELMQLLLSAPEGVASPWFAPETAELFHRFYGLDRDRFRQEKQDSNAFVLARLDRIREKVRSAPDPVLAALQFAILGNYIDFSALRGEVSFAALDGMLEKALDMELDGQVYAALLADLAAGKRLLFLTDNAGEIGFDRVLGEEIARRFPHLEITFCVRGGPANNDATREDARAVGLPFPVIDNGNCIPGTQLDCLSPEARAAFESADVILSKGQGNAETLLGCGYNIYYAFLVKCIRFIRRFDREKLTPMLVREVRQQGGA